MTAPSLFPGTAAYRSAYMRDYRRRNKARMRELDRMYDRARHANQRAAKYGAPGRLRTQEVREVMAAGACAYCGSTRQLGIDHVVPLSAQGPNRPENLVCCCHGCNSSKFQGDRPGRWARHWDCCVKCSGTDRAHEAKGLCRRCYLRARRAAA